MKQPSIPSLLTAAMLSLAAPSITSAATFERCYLFHNEEYMSYGTKDDEGHIKALWNKYADLESRDLPSAAREVLKDIISAASSGGHDLDFYDASVKYVRSVAMTDWRSSSQAVEFILSKASQAKMSPVLDFMILTTFRSADNREVMDFIETFREELSAGHSKEFYDTPLSDRYGRSFGKNLPSFVYSNISNDYEFALWRSYNKMNPWLGITSRGSMSSEPLDLLCGYLGNTYPNGKYAGLRQFLDKADYHSVDEFASANKTKALSLYATEAILEHRMDSLSGLSARVPDRSAAMQTLISDCRSFLYHQSSFRGTEKTIASGCTGVNGLIDRITAPSVRMKKESGGLSLYASNLPYLDVTLYRDSIGGPALGSARIANTVRSCHFPDTLFYRFPDMDDGACVLAFSSGNFKTSFNFVRSRLTIATTYSEGSHRFYVCESSTGRPLDKADICIISGKDTVARYHDYPLDRFTPVEIKDSRDKYVRAIFSCNDDHGYRKSSWVRISSVQDKQKPSDPSLKAVVFTDRSAFNPGDTLKYKVLVYNQLSGNPLGVAGLGTAFKVRFTDQSGKPLSSYDLTLGEFGSAAGEFVIPKDIRNGSLRIAVYEGNSPVGSEYVTVDDFVLPDFEIVFDHEDEMRFLGDSLVVKGRVKAYSGHNLVDAKASYSVSGNSEEGLSGSLDLLPDGSFEIPVFTEKSDVYSQYYQVRVRVTEATGMTVERSHSFSVPSGLGINAELLNPGKGRVDTDREQAQVLSYLMEGDSAFFVVTASNYLNRPVALALSYEVSRSGKVLRRGNAFCSDTLKIDLKGCPSGIYDVTFNAAARSGAFSGKTVCRLVRMEDGNELGFNARRAYRKLSAEGKVSMLYGSSEAPLWALAVVSDAGRRILDSRIVTLKEGGSLTRIDFDWVKDWPDDVKMTILDVKDGLNNVYSADYQRTEYDDKSLPLSFSSFTDTAHPGQICTIGIASRPETECIVTVYDKSLETVRQHGWRRISPYKPYISLPLHFSIDWETEAIPFQRVLSKGVENEEFADAVAPAPRIPVREYFAKTLCFEPFARTSQEGKAMVTFPARDNLSTFVVSVFAHDKSMNNNVLRREMVVTQPLKVSVGKPQYLYEGDSFNLAASVQNLSGNQLDGMLYCYVYKGNDYKNSEPFMTLSSRLTVGAEGESSGSFLIDAGDDSDELGFKVVFQAGNYSDGVFVTVPVKRAQQTLTEAHSMVLRPDMDENEALDSLRSRFTGTSPYGAEYSVKTLEDIVSDFCLSTSPTGSKDVISWAGVFTKALYAGLFSRNGLSAETDYQKLMAEAIAGMSDCLNADGGFSWLPGMPSSLALTESILFRMNSIVENGQWKDVDSTFCKTLDRAVKYMDDAVAKDFASSRNLTHDWRWFEDYLFIRTRIGAVSPWTGSRLPSSALFDQSGARKQVADALVCQDATKGNIVSKIKRASVLLDMVGDKDGFCRNAGFSRRDLRRMKVALKAETESAIDYAVGTPQGGIHYPSAFYPWFNILSSEAFVHTVADRFFRRFVEAVEEDRNLGKYIGTELPADASRICDGMKIWTLLQKENLKWEDDPSLVEVLVSLLNAPSNIKYTRIISLSKTYTKPFSEIVPASNGMNIDVKYYRQITSMDETSGSSFRGEDSGWTLLKDGDMLNVGDRVKAVYTLRNETARSFVLLSVPRPSFLRPQMQLSGWEYLSDGAVRKTIFPPYRNCYREVRADRTRYWFDIFPEGGTTITEMLTVTMQGSFSCPAAAVQSQYAPSYRANTAALFLK
ncbi:MAG: MG2 domain-containing protein [Candidatus Cryptobacteroides sp.]